MISALKRIIKSYMKARGYHIVWVNPARTTTGFAFEDDLRRVVNRSDPVCLDIGANEGQTIRLFKRVFEEPFIHAFEPTPACFQRLSDQVPDHHTQLHQLAMGDSQGSLELNQYSHSTLNSLLPLSQTPPIRITICDGKRRYWSRSRLSMRFSRYARYRWCTCLKSTLRGSICEFFGEHRTHSAPAEYRMF